MKERPVPLLERDEQLNTLHQLLDDVSSGNGHLALIAGEAGVGKTSLVRTFGDRIAGNVPVFRGFCDPLETPRPLGPLLDLAPQLSSELSDLLQRGVSRFQVFQSFMSALGSRASGMVVVIEDIHWADEATLDLIRFVGRRIDSVPALLLLTFRNDQVNRRDPLQLVLGDIATSGGVSRLEIKPLSKDAVRLLVGNTSVDAAALHQQTGGNPFFVTEVLANGGNGIPATVRDAVLGRAGRLSRSARSVLDSAAVIGPQISEALLREITQADSDTVEECLSIGVLDSLDGGYAFRHELARDAILEVLPSHRKVDVHRVALEKLERWGALERSDELARLATHAEGAQDAGAVAKYAPRAGERASQLGAHREAASQYRRALRWIEPEQNEEMVAELLERLSEEYQITDRLDDAIEALDRALLIWEELQNRERQGVVLGARAIRLVYSGRNAEAEASASKAVSLLKSTSDGSNLARALQIQAHLRMLDRDNKRAIEVGKQALELARKKGTAKTRIASQITLGSALLMSGDREGVRLLEESVQLGRDTGWDELVAHALGNLGTGLGELFHLEESINWLYQADEFTADRDMDFWNHYIRAWMALIHMYLGDWSKATSIASALIQEPNLAAISAITVRTVLGRLRLRRGDPGVWSLLDEAMNIASDTETLQRVAPPRLARAEAAYLEGDLRRSREEARAEYTRALSQQHSWFVGEMAYWQWKSGESIHAPDWIAEPYILQMNGKWELAAERWRVLRCPYEQARALSESGSETPLREALSIFERLGAAPMIAVTQSELRALGVRRIPRRPRNSTRSNPAGLTSRELEVASLLSEGLTNRQIADRLFLSTRTVEHHVSSAFAKLGARSRIDAARAINDLRQAPPN
jgi:DNA-binding CsgD family transcriptional regulator/tetratricopeptide (TPR) repeat protein